MIRSLADAPDLVADVVKIAGVASARRFGPAIRDGWPLPGSGSFVVEFENGSVMRVWADYPDSDQFDVGVDAPDGETVRFGASTLLVDEPAASVLSLAAMVARGSG